MIFSSSLHFLTLSCSVTTLYPALSPYFHYPINLLTKLSFFLKNSSDEDAFRESVESITGPITRIISRDGMLGVYEQFDDAGKKIFEQAYSAAIGPAMDICYEIYEDVACGNEIKSVVNAVERFDRWPMGIIDQTHMWQVGKKVRAERVEEKIPINEFTAGMEIPINIGIIKLEYL